MFWFILLWVLMGFVSAMPEAENIEKIDNKINKILCYCIYIGAGPVLLIAGLLTWILEGLMPNDGEQLK